VHPVTRTAIPGCCRTLCWEQVMPVMGQYWQRGDVMRVTWWQVYCLYSVAGLPPPWMRGPLTWARRRRQSTHGGWVGINILLAGSTGLIRLCHTVNNLVVFYDSSPSHQNNIRSTSTLSSDHCQGPVGAQMVDINWLPHPLHLLVCTLQMGRAGGPHA
jgi:hypothetical protein